MTGPVEPAAPRVVSLTLRCLRRAMLPRIALLILMRRVRVSRRLRLRLGLRGRLDAAGLGGE